MEAGFLLFLQNNLRNPVLDPVILFITRLDNGGVVWLVMIALLLMFKKTRKAGIYCLAALLVDVTIVSGIIKPLVGRVRPYEVIEGLTSMIGPQWDTSFPSGHTASSFAVAFTCFLKGPKKIGIPALVLAALIGFSRLYVGVHYPSDVICGLFIGIAASLITVFILNRISAKLDSRKQQKASQ